MAHKQDESPDQIARKWFVITMLGALAFIALSYVFVISPDLSEPAAAEGEVELHD